MKLISALKDFLFMGKLRSVTLVVFDLVCFADELFETFGVALTPDNFRDFCTVGQLADFICSAKANA